MRRPAPHETVGLVLLGIVLFSLGLALRQAQPGLVATALPGWAWPVAAAIVYIVVALLATHAQMARAALFLGALLVLHIVYALLMGLAFAVESQTPSGLTPAPLIAGLCAYPPAVVLQAAFVIPLGCTLFGAGPQPAASTEAAGENAGQADAAGEIGDA